MSIIAVINAGSSSIKFAVFQAASTPSLLLRGQIEGIGATPRAKLLIRKAIFFMRKVLKTKASTMPLQLRRR